MDVFWPITVLETELISLSAPLGTSSLHSPYRASILLHPQMRWHCAGHLMGPSCSSRVWHPVWSRSGNSTGNRQEESGFSSHEGGPRSYRKGYLFRRAMQLRKDDRSARVSA